MVVKIKRIFWSGDQQQKIPNTKEEMKREIMLKEAELTVLKKLYEEKKE